MTEFFEWDPQKAKTNISKHGISFEEAQSAFFDAESLTIPDPDHSTDEDRFILIGKSIRQKELVIVHTFRDDKIRIISARKANRRERQMYDQKG